MRRSVLSACAKVIAVMFFVPGCGAPKRGEVVPLEFQDSAEVADLGPGVRKWGSDLNPAFQAVLFRSVERERAWLGLTPDDHAMPPAEFLAISGGGANGAFGAGLMCGWAEAGD